MVGGGRRASRRLSFPPWGNLRDDSIDGGPRGYGIRDPGLALIRSHVTTRGTGSDLITFVGYSFIRGRADSRPLWEF